VSVRERRPLRKRYEIVEIDLFGFKIVEIVEAAPSEVLSTSGHVTV